MKFTLSEVFDAYVVVDDDTGETVHRETYAGSDTVTLSFESEGLEYSADFEDDQTVTADGEIFKAVGYDENSHKVVWGFRALTVVRLNEVPELR